MAMCPKRFSKAAQDVKKEYRISIHVPETTGEPHDLEVYIVSRDPFKVITTAALLCEPLRKQYGVKPEVRILP